MKFCPYCGAELLDETIAFCTECGKALPEKEQQSEQEEKIPPKKKKKPKASPLRRAIDSKMRHRVYSSRQTMEKRPPKPAH